MYFYCKQKENGMATWISSLCICDNIFMCSVWFQWWDDGVLGVQILCQMTCQNDLCDVTQLPLSKMWAGHTPFQIVGDLSAPATRGAPVRSCVFNSYVYWVESELKSNLFYHMKAKGLLKPKWQDRKRESHSADEFTQRWFGLPVCWWELAGGKPELVRIIDCVKWYQGLTEIGVTCLLILVSPLKRKMKQKVTTSSSVASYDHLLSTSLSSHCMIGDTVGLRKLSASWQFFTGAQMAVSL